MPLFGIRSDATVVTCNLLVSSYMGHVGVHFNVSSVVQLLSRLLNMYRWLCASMCVHTFSDQHADLPKSSVHGHLPLTGFARDLQGRCRHSGQKTTDQIDLYRRSPGEVEISSFNIATRVPKGFRLAVL